VTLEMADNEVRTHPVGGAATALAFSPDGKRIVFELNAGEYPDIAVLDVKTSKVSRLTRNDSPDRYPVFSPDGKRVYFEARNTDPVFGKKRAVSRIAWVAPCSKRSFSIDCRRRAFARARSGRARRSHSVCSFRTKRSTTALSSSGSSS